MYIDKSTKQGLISTVHNYNLIIRSTLSELLSYNILEINLSSVSFIRVFHSLVKLWICLLKEIMLQIEYPNFTDWPPKNHQRLLLLMYCAAQCI